MSLTARECDLGDAIVTYLQSLWTTRSDPDAVQRVWVANIGLNPDDPQTLVEGRQIFVIPVSQSTPERMSRAELDNLYTFVILTAERYTDKTGGYSGDPPNDWIDERVAFVEQTVYYPLGDPSLVLSGSVVKSAWPARTERPVIDVLLDRERLLQDRCFLNQITVVFEDLTDYSGATVLE